MSIGELKLVVAKSSFGHGLANNRRGFVRNYRRAFEELQKDANDRGKGVKSRRGCAGRTRAPETCSCTGSSRDYVTQASDRGRRGRRD